MDVAAGAQRYLVLTADTYTWLTEPKDKHEEELLRARCATFCTVFVEKDFGLGLALSSTGYKGRLAQLKIVSPKPGARIIGTMAAQDAFIGVSLWMRDEIAFKFSAAEGRRRPWQDVQSQAWTKLNELLPDGPFMTVKEAIRLEDETYDPKT